MCRQSAVIFDLDGTLIDSHRDIAAALNDVLASLDLPTHDPSAVKTMIGGGVATLLARGLGEERMHLFDAARARFKDAYRARLVETTRCYDGIVELLEALRREGIGAAVATNKPSMFTRELASALELDRLICAFACADEVEEKKPNPAVVHLALARTGRDRALAYVGDMPVDRATSERAGIPFVGVAWGFDPTGLAAPGNTWLVQDTEGLREALLGLERKARTSTRPDR